uniref:Uncharacterized protein LOC111110262 isoform X2 n=1 Tax=Crassostrea virginica TaxID=6565 RepID=A0A8B8BGA3_CRAVI|nr:uncharacterized protein LOC111110262 isoform X2 [Crassostrea virginica]
MFISIWIFSLLFHFTVSNFMEIQKSRQTVCHYSALVNVSFDANCTGNLTVNILLPPGFWEAMKRLHYKRATFDVQGTPSHQNWMISCFQELRIIFQEEFRCSYEQPPAKRCFPAPNTTTSRGITVTKKIFPGHTSSLVFFLISIIAFGALILGLIVACWRHRRTFQEHIKSGLKVAVLELSEDPLHSATESQTLCNHESSLRENFNTQLKDHCLPTIICLRTPVDCHRIMSEVAHLIQSHDAFVIVPSIRMLPMQEDIADPDVQVAIGMLRLLYTRTPCCVFVRFSNDNTDHQGVRNRYRHFLQTPVYTFNSTTKSNSIPTRKITKMLKYLEKKSYQNNFQMETQGIV